MGGWRLSFLLALLGGSADADRLTDKRAEATRVQNELDQMDVALAKAVEAYDAAQTRPDATEAAIRENQLELAITKKNLAIAQSDLTTQLVADYRSGSPDTIGVLLGAASISDMLARIDIVKRSSGHTAELVGKVLTFKKQTETASKKLAKQQKARQQALADRAARKAEIRAGIAARQNRLSSIGREIKQIIAEREAAERRAAAARAAAARAAAAAAAAEPVRRPPASADPPAAARSTAATAAAVRAPGVAMAAVVAGRRRWRRVELRRRRQHPAAPVGGRLVGRVGCALAARRALPVGRRAPVAASTAPASSCGRTPRRARRPPAQRGR